MSGTLVSGILCLVGAATLLFVVKSIIETVAFMRAANRAVGKVVYLATTRDSDGHTIYLPVFEYRTNDGSVYQHTSTVASRPPAYEVGETATLLYLKKSTQTAKIKSFSELWLVKTIFAVIGLACLGGAALTFMLIK